MRLEIETITVQNMQPEGMSKDDLAMLRMIDSYTPDRQAQREAALQTSGIDPERLRLHALGVVCLTGAEMEQRTQALFV